MPQVLKDEVKDKIVNAAAEEFLDKGYEHASMRNIAIKSKMTVGNLYRYFKNKEALNIFLVTPTLEKINETIKRLTHNMIDLKNDNFTFDFTNKELKEMLDELGDNLVDIYDDNKIPFNILMMHSKINEQITLWFSNLLGTYIKHNYRITNYDHEIDILARSYAVSLFSGFKECFRISDVSIIRLKAIIKVYLRSYVYMFDKDIKEYLGE